MQNEIPEFLSNYDLMVQHFRSELEERESEAENLRDLCKG